MNEQTISAIVLPSWLKAAARCGVDIKPILAAEGISLDLAHLDGRRLPLAAFGKVLRECTQAARQHHFPFVVGENFAFEYIPDLEMYLTTSSSLRDAARVFDWLPALLNPVLDARLEEDAQAARLVLYLPENTAAAERPYYVEAFFASLLKFARSLAGEAADLRALHVQHPAPPYAPVYEAYFGIPVRFGQAQNALIFGKGMLDRPLQGDLPTLHRQARELLEDKVAQLREQGSLTSRVRELLLHRPELLAQGIGTVAARLRTSPRTLQRRLRAEGTGYSDLVDRARYRWARHYLDRGDDLEATSEALGFSDRRSFTRAFKRWSGVTPSAYRRQAGAPAAATTPL